MSKNFLLRKAVTIALRRPADSRIPQSGDTGRAVDCFSIELRTTDGIHYDLQVDGITSHSITGRLWNGSRYEDRGELVLKYLDDVDFNGTHFLGLNQVSYSSALEFVVFESLRIPYLIFTYRRFLQLIFNQKTPKRMERIEILQRLVEFRLNTAAEPAQMFVDDRQFIGLDSLIRRKYGDRILGHPHYYSLRVQTQMVLESLCNSGDVVDRNGGYRALGQALHTISEYEEDNRRHRDRTILNSIIAVFTFFMALAALVQIMESSMIKDIFE